MKGLLARLNEQKNPTLGSKGASRSTSIASSVDDPNEDDQQSNNSDESQSLQTSNTLKPNVKKDKKPGFNSGKEIKPKVASRINSNIMKLKLLDATRKAIIEKTKRTFESSYTQTDAIKTRLCKDVEVEVQNDLVNPVDASTETDVELVAYKAKDGTLIVTSTCAVNTDKVVTDTRSTQTVMPRSNVSFKNFLEPKHKIQYDDDENEMSDDDDTDDATMEIINIEKRIRKKKLARQKSQQSAIDIVVENEASDVIESETIKTAKKKDSDSEFEDSITDDLRPDVVKGSMKRPKQSDSTFNSWHDLDFPQDKVELPKSYFTDGPTPWSNFSDLVLGQRFLNARLSPVPPRHQRPNMKHVTWSDSQVKIVNDLIKEANALLDMFDQVAMLLGPDIKLHNVSDVEDFVLPPSKYGAEMTESCEKLEASLKRLQGIQKPEKIPI